MIRLSLALLLLLCWPAFAWAQQREAYHEVCHAIVAQDLGAVVNEISIVETAEDKGATFIFDRNLSAKQRAMISIAGYVGEVIFLQIDDRPHSQADFKEARKVYSRDLNALVPEVNRILNRHRDEVPTLAGELQNNGQMTGLRFRELIGAPEPTDDHPAKRAEGTYIGNGVHAGGKPPWADRGWNQAYTDWQDQFEGPLCFFSALGIGIWGIACIWLNSKGRLTRGHWTAYKACVVIIALWYGITTYIQYGTGPSN